VLDRQRPALEGAPVPLTARAGSTTAEIVVLMRDFGVRHMPIVDDDRVVLDIALLDDLVVADGPALRAVVMAGGFGRRLAPLTDATPKPMLPVGDKPLLQRIVEQLRDAGIRHVNLTTHYREEAIARHFGDGTKFGVQIEYVSEDRPLGTAGALGLVEADDDAPILVMNGDILTGVDVRALHQFHLENQADMTVAVRPYEVPVPFGVIELDGAAVTGITEKPLGKGFVNAGIYLVNADIRLSVVPGEPLEMPELIARLVEEDRRVVGFPLREYWLDIGRIADYEQALADVEGL
jgi:NDP-sugar pyrophosphorylase family protein